MLAWQVETLTLLPFFMAIALDGVKVQNYFENKNDGNIINVANKNNFINFDVIVDKNTLRRNDENATTNENPTMSSSESENVQTPNHRTTQTKRVSNLEEHNQPKDKHEKDAKTMPIDVHQVKHKKPWYTPIVRLCSWVKCKVLSWFGY